MIERTIAAKGNLFGNIIPARYILAILGSIAMSIVYGLKVNLSVAMVAMLNHTAINVNLPVIPQQQLAATVISNGTTLKPLMTAVISDGAHHSNDVCLGTGANEAPEDGPFDWNEPLQGTILSCYFWGYFISQIPGAWIAENFSAKWVMLFSVAINVLCTLLTPVMANLDYIAMILMRIGEGVGGGVTFPAMHVMLAAWAPPNERSTMSAIVYAGTSLGTVSSMLMAGILAGNYGWESVFYVMGGFSCIWIFLWIWLVQDTPSKQVYISPEERDYIMTSLGSSEHSKYKAKPALPWKKVFTSVPFLAILIAHICSNFGWYMLLIELPFYMKQVLKFNIRENAIATALPFLAMWIFSMILSKTLDTMKAKGKIDTTRARKIATLCSSVVPMICLFILCFIGCQRTVAVVLMGIAITSIGGMFCGFLSNHIDIAPNYAGTLIAITNTAATIPGITVPIFVGSITHGNHTIEAWRTIFFVTIILYIIEIISYSTMGSGEEQPWNKHASIHELMQSNTTSDNEEDHKSESTALNIQETSGGGYASVEK